MKEDARTRLYEAVAEQMGYTLPDDEEDYRSDLSEIAEHGADAGWGGFTYMLECCEFYAANKEDIWELAQEMADELGEKNVPAMVARFNHADMATSVEGFENLLAWFALEEVARGVEDKVL